MCCVSPPAWVHCYGRPRRLIQAVPTSPPTVGWEGAGDRVLPFPEISAAGFWWCEPLTELRVGLLLKVCVSLTTRLLKKPIHLPQYPSERKRPDPTMEGNCPRGELAEPSTLSPELYGQFKGFSAAIVSMCNSSPHGLQ